MPAVLGRQGPVQPGRIKQQPAEQEIPAPRFFAVRTRLLRRPKFFRSSVRFRPDEGKFSAAREIFCRLLSKDDEKMWEKMVWVELKKKGTYGTL